MGEDRGSRWFDPRPGDRWALQRTVRSTRAAVMWGLVRSEKTEPKNSDVRVDVGETVRGEHGLFEREVQLSGTSVPTTTVWVHRFDGELWARTDSGFQPFLELGDLEATPGAHDPLAGHEPRACRIALLPDHRCVCAVGPLDAARPLSGPVRCHRDSDGLKVVGAFIVGVMTAGVFIPPVEFDDIGLVWSGNGSVQ